MALLLKNPQNISEFLTLAPIPYSCPMPHEPVYSDQRQPSLHHWSVVVQTVLILW